MSKLYSTFWLWFGRWVMGAGVSVRTSLRTNNVLCMLSGTSTYAAPSGVTMERTRGLPSTLPRTFKLTEATRTVDIIKDKVKTGATTMHSQRSNLSQSTSQSRQCIPDMLTLALLQD
jgi:hypothetical protein